MLSLLVYYYKQLTENLISVNECLIVSICKSILSAKQNNQLGTNRLKQITLMNRQLKTSTKRLKKIDSII